MPDPIATPVPFEPQPQTPVWRTAMIAAALTGIIAVIVLAFSWPAVTANPKEVSIALAGPPAAASAIATQLEQQGVFDVTVVADRAAAVAGIEQREYYGAIVIGEQPELLTASANGTVNQVVTQLATPLQDTLTEQAQAAAQSAGIEAPDVALIVTDVVPLSDEDPTGSLLTSAFFPMLFGGILGGVLITTLIVGTSRRLLAVGVYAIVGGVVLAGILQLWFGSIQGDYWTNVAAFALTLAAIAAPLVGFVSLMGPAGTAVGLVLMMLVANPISGSALPAQFLPGPWGEIGQWFPPGAAATLIRELSYFPDASTTFHWLVLAGWAAGGIALTLIGDALRGSESTAVGTATDTALERETPATT